MSKTINFKELLIELYNIKKDEFGDDSYKHISDLLNEAKVIHREDFLKRKPNGDSEQSWRTTKGSSLEYLIQHIVADQVKALGLGIINGSILDKQSIKLSPELQEIKRNLVIDYGEFGMHLPDVDIVIYNPKNHKDIIAISIKSSLRDRIAQTGYWKLKLMQSDLTKHILVYFISLDEDGVLNPKNKYSKPRAIVEVDTDSCYILTQTDIRVSDNVKTFDKLIDDLKLWLSKKE